SIHQPAAGRFCSRSLHGEAAADSRFDFSFRETRPKALCLCVNDALP
ncbi:uncharacterized, partial [Tachysurus ichikawai]